MAERTLTKYTGINLIIVLSDTRCRFFLCSRPGSKIASSKQRRVAVGYLPPPSPRSLFRPKRQVAVPMEQNKTLFTRWGITQIASKKRNVQTMCWHMLEGYFYPDHWEQWNPSDRDCLSVILQPRWLWQERKDSFRLVYLRRPASAECERRISTFIYQFKTDWK